MSDRDELAAVIHHRGWVSNPAVREGIADVILTSDWLAAHDADLRERIARDIQAACPSHMTRDYTPVDAAYDNAARIARTTRGVGPSGSAVAKTCGPDCEKCLDATEEETE